MNVFKKIGHWFVAHKPTKRRLIQVYAALLYNANIKGFITGNIYTGNTKYACVPGLNCYSCPGAVGACPLGALQNALASSDTKAPFYVIGIILLFGLLLGRTICGFLCPMGLIQDLLYKIKTPKLKKSKVTRVLSYLKYVILVMMVICIPLAYAGATHIPAFCKYICPDGTLLGSIFLLISGRSEDFLSKLGPLFTWKFCVLVAIIVGAIFIYRIFCRFLCPLGALYSLFCRISMLGIKLDKQKCVDCGLCIKTCKMDIKHVGDHECIHCGDCLKVCPTKAITWKGSKIFLHANAIEEGGDSAAGEKVALYDLLSPSKAAVAAATSSASTQGAVSDAAANVSFEYAMTDAKNEKDEKQLKTIENNRKKEEKKVLKQEKKEKRHSLHKTLSWQRKRNVVLQIVAWAIALVILIGALIYYNFIVKDVVADVIYSEGDTVASFTLKKYFGDEDDTYSLQDDLDEGRIVVLNFWYTTCGPCEAELPYFGEMAETYSDDVSLVVIHSSTMSTDIPVEYYVSEIRGWEFQYLDNVSFTMDLSDSESVYKSFDGDGSYPMTVILDNEGVVQFIKKSKMEESELYEQVDALIAAKNN